MKKIELTKDWRVHCLTRETEDVIVDLPHDAMISEPRSPLSRGEGNIGWYIGGDYEYTKRFAVPEEWRDQTAVLEFEGVYRNAEIYLNGEKVAYRPYGYTDFFVEADPFLKVGEENELRVIAHNSKQPNSRWYSGTGIYRPVNIWLGSKRHILVNGVKIRTLDDKAGTVEVHVQVSEPGSVKLEILDGEQVAFSEEKEAEKKDVLFRCVIPDVKSWSPEHPYLYTARVTAGNDEAEERFGVRTLKWNPEEGLTINGERVILRGACIHHDNGLLGACAYPEAEERKVRLLMENGYNAIRSAHNPCSKALLDACDRLGMLVMDEYVDAWFMHKTRYDYVSDLKEWWRQDLRDMVDKDYNHPSVIMYSTGNEVAETARPDGITFTGVMTNYLHQLDRTRPVSCGINIFFNFLSSIGFGVYSDEKAEQESQNAGKKKKKAVGSEFYNKLSLLMGDSFMKFGATLYGSDVKTRDAYAKMDIAGYNYGIWRYRKDMKKYPNRLILGSETFCKDAWLFHEIAKDNPQIIGDFVWSGMDYIGETGLGAPEYGDYKIDAPETQMTGANGRIDITGKPRGEAAYTRVALGVETGPLIAVQPVNRDDDPGLTGWSLTKALESWAWSGCDGAAATVEVYARAAEVELILNGKSVGRKKASRTCRTLFTVSYEPGELTAVSYDENGAEIGRETLKSAGEETVLQILPEKESITSGGLGFVRLRYTDGQGVWKPLARKVLMVSVEHGKLLGLGSGNSYVRGNYTGFFTDTYYGEALAIVQADGTGDVKIKVTEANETGTVYTAEIPLAQETL